jgi:O-antigen/teichoic acid export membrane protein
VEDPLLDILGKLQGDDLLKKGTFMFLATSVTGVINILFRAVMGRMMTVEEFGEFNAIFALAFFLSFILTRTIRTSTTDFVSQRLGRGEAPTTMRELFRVLRTLTVVGSLFTAIFVLLAWPIMGFLKLDSVWVVLSAVPFLAVSWVLPVNLGLFQGSQRFLLLAVSTMSQASLKMVFGAVFVLLGLGAFGAMMGVGLGALGALAVSLVFIIVVFRRSMSTEDDGTGGGVGPAMGTMIPMRELINVSGHVLMAILCLAILTNIDVLLVKHFFTSEETGLYSAAIVFGRLIYFLPVGFITVMYPKMVASHAKGSDNLGTLARGLVYIGVPVLALTAFLSRFPSFALELLMGSKYVGAEDLVVLYSFLMFIFSLVSVLVYYFLAVKSYPAVYAFAVVSVIQTVVAWFHHPDLETIIWIFICANLAYLVIAATAVAKNFVSRDGGGGPSG